MRPLSVVGAAALLALAILLLSSDSLVVVSVLAAIGLVIRLSAAASWRTALLTIWPVVLFASLLALLGWAGGHPSAMLPLKTIGLFLLVISAVNLVPWAEATSRLVSHPAIRVPVLTALITRHFVLVLGGEARRVMIAHRVSAPNRWRRGWFRSLGWALVGLFRQSLARAERFYAAQLVRGLGE